MIHRYFEVTVIHRNEAFEICEYFADFGYWKCNTSDYHRKKFVSGQMWHVCTNLVLTDSIFESVIALIINRGVAWSEVSLIGVSNPITLRKPAMGKKRR